MTSQPVQFASFPPIESFGKNNGAQPQSGWEIFSTQGGLDENSQQDENDEVKQAFMPSASYDITKEEAQNNVGIDDSAERAKITSMFLANQKSNDTMETGSLYQTSVSSRPPTARSSKRPSTAMPRFDSSTEVIEEGAILTSIFSIDKVSYDVRLYEDRIAWTPVSPKKQRRPSSGRFSDTQKKASKGDLGSISIHNICSVKLKNMKSGKTGNSTTIGFAVFAAEERNGQKLREKCITFICFSREICTQWATRIKQKILARTDRPRHLLVLSCGTMASAQMWDDIVEPKLEVACVKAKYMDFDDPAAAAEYVKTILAEQSTSRGSEAYDGILVLAGARLFSEVLNAIMDFKEKSLKSAVWHPSVPPVGIVPTSTGSCIAREIHGCSDAETAVMHAIYGCTYSIPVCEFYDNNEQLVKYGLFASYGFSGGDTVRSSSAKGFAAVQGTIKKGFAFTKALVKLRSYPCEIQYKDAFHGDDDDDLTNEYSVINQYFVDDEAHETSHLAEGKGGPQSSDWEPSGTHDGDSGIWPQFEKWNNVPRTNYVDITISSLPQNTPGQPQTGAGGQLTAILVRDSTSRKDLILGMGSQVSLNSAMHQTKNKPELQSKQEILTSSEFTVHPVLSQSMSHTSSNNASHSSTWTVDGCCVAPSVQEMHIKVHELPLVMYGRAPGQHFATAPPPDVLKLDVDMANVTLDSVA